MTLTAALASPGRAAAEAPVAIGEPGVPPAAASTLPAASTRASVAREDDRRCAFHELCAGPVATLGAIDPIGLGVHLRYGDYLGFAIDYQFLPTRIGIGAATSTWSLFTAEGRVHPFGNAFFFAAGFGYQHVSARVHQMTPSGDVSMTGAIGLPALKLGIGFVGRSGFILGADIGINAQIGRPRVHLGKASGPGADYPYGTVALEQEVQDAADDARRFPIIPQVNLMRLGYLF